MHLDGGTGYSRRFPQEGSLTLVRLDKIESDAGGEAQHEPRKPGARAKVDPSLRPRNHERNQLERIRDMPVPEGRLVCSCHQIDGVVPAHEQGDVAVERVPGFMWNII